MLCVSLSSSSTSSCDTDTMPSIWYGVSAVSERLDSGKPTSTSPTSTLTSHMVPSNIEPMSGVDCHLICQAPTLSLSCSPSSLTAHGHLQDHRGVYCLPWLWAQRNLLLSDEILRHSSPRTFSQATLQSLSPPNPNMSHPPSIRMFSLAKISAVRHHAIHCMSDSSSNQRSDA